MVNKTILFSFIIPCYNAAGTLERVVQSIYADGNDTDEYEVILVINGCTDNTLELAQMLQKKYNMNLRIAESDKGVSKARNEGIRQAHGKWIAFLDADDMLAESAMRCLLDDGTHVTADLILYGHRKGNETIHILEGREKKQLCEDNELDKAKLKMISNPTRYMQVWAKLFRKEVIDRNAILFHEQMKLAEDSDFMLRYLRYCEKILFHDEIVYEYSLNEQSTVRTYDGKKVQEYIYSMKESSKGMQDESPAIQGAFEKYVLMHLNIAMVREVFCKQNKASFTDKVRKMREVSNELPFAAYIKNVKMKECTSVRMIPILCLKLRWDLFAGMIYNIRANQNSKREKGSI